MNRDKVVAKRVLTESEIHAIIDTNKRMHTPCIKDNKKLNAATFPDDDDNNIHTCPEDYKSHLELRSAWLAMLCSMLQGIVHPRLPSKTGDLEDIQKKAAKELQKFLYGNLSSIPYRPNDSSQEDLPEKFNVPVHRGEYFIVVQL